MTNDEINKYIHEQIMGKRIEFQIKDGDKQMGLFANYCSDASPRSLLNEVVAKVVAVRGLDPYGRALTATAFQHGIIDDHQHALFLMNTPAEQIARACVAAHQEGK